MIARHWRGATSAENADAYEALLKTKVLPELAEIEGYRGGYVLRRDVPEAREVEFIVINLFDSLESVKRFAGPEYAVAVFEPQARVLLKRAEPLAAHFEVRHAPG
jgi:heme-degrading monooxygenase HmoA